MYAYCAKIDYRSGFARHVDVRAICGLFPNCVSRPVWEIIAGRVVTLSAGFNGLHIGVGKIDEDSQPIAFLDDSRTEFSQSAVARRVGVNVT